MKKYILILAALLALTGCAKKSYKISDDPFDITVSQITSSSVKMSVIPETNDFLYTFDAVAASEVEKYKTDEEFIRAWDAERHQNIVEINQLMPEKKYTFEDMYLYNGAYDDSNLLLDSETDYYVVAVVYNNDGTPTNILKKVPFRTIKYVESDITFTLTAKGTDLTITPSNDDPYFWEFDTKATYDEYTLPPLYHFLLIYFYDEYGFMEDMVCTGEDSDDLVNWFEDMKPGDQFYVSASGYNKEINSLIQMWLVTYNGEGADVTIEDYEFDLSELDLSVLGTKSSMNFRRNFLSLPRISKDKISLTKL